MEDLSRDLQDLRNQCTLGLLSCLSDTPYDLIIQAAVLDGQVTALTKERDTWKETAEDLVNKVG